jgi:hypothetical protein
VNEIRRVQGKSPNRRFGSSSSQGSRDHSSRYECGSEGDDLQPLQTVVDHRQEAADEAALNEKDFREKMRKLVAAGEKYIDPLWIPPPYLRQMILEANRSDTAGPRYHDLLHAIEVERLHCDNREEPMLFEIVDAEAKMPIRLRKITRSPQWLCRWMPRMDRTIRGDLDRMPEKKVLDIISDFTRRDLNDGWEGLDNRNGLMCSIIVGNTPTQPMEKDY